MAATQVAFVLQSGQRRGLQFTIASGSNLAATQPQEPVWEACIFTLFHWFCLKQIRGKWPSKQKDYLKEICYQITGVEQGYICIKIYISDLSKKPNDALQLLRHFVSFVLSMWKWSSLCLISVVQLRGLKSKLSCLVKFYICSRPYM